MITENLTTLKIHKLTRDQYNRELEAGNIDENALYLTPDETTDLSMYATKEDLNDKADKTHTHDNYATTDYVDGNFALKSEIGNIELSGYVKKSDLEIHNTNIEAHNDIRDLISGLSTKVTNFLDVDEDTTDQLSEVLTLINNNKGTLESLTTTKVNVSDIINNLTTNVSNKPLSAAQGVEIKRLIDILQDELDSLESTVDGKADENHGHSNATTTTDGFMSAYDNILLGKLRSQSLGSFGSYTIPQAKTALENWIASVYDTPNASAHFACHFGNFIYLWNSNDTTSTIGDGVNFTIELTTIYGANNYALLRLTSYYDKNVYYVAYSNGVWNPIRTVQFTDDVVSKASTILETVANPTDGRTYHIPFHAGVSTSYQSLYTNDGIKYYTREGTASAGGTAQLGLGNNIPTGTAGNKNGSIYLYGTSSGYTDIIPTNNTTSNSVIYLPSSSGTLARTADNVASASKLYRSSSLSTIEETDAFFENGYMKFASCSSEATSIKNDGVILSIPYSSTHAAQIWLDDGSGEGGMAIRSKTASAWNPWRKVLTENNYSEYALPITGGTVNGHLTVNGNICAYHPTGGEQDVGVRYSTTDDNRLYLYGNSSTGTRGIYDTLRGMVISVTNSSASFLGNANSATYSGHIIRNDGNATATLAYSNANKSSLGWGIKMTDSNNKPSYIYLTANAENEAPWMRLYGADGSTYTDVLTKANYYNWALPLACNSDTPLTGILYFSTNNWAGDIVGRNASNQKRWELFSNSNTGAVADCILHVHKNTEGTTYAQYKFGTDGTLTATKFKGTLDGNATSADTASSLSNFGTLTTSESVNNFITSNKLQYALFQLQSDTGVGFASNDGMLLSIPWNSTNYGAQIAIDDSTTNPKIAIRSKNYSWGDWKILPFSDGTNASGTWGINITGNAGSATKLATSRTISLTGSVTGSGTFDGSGNLSIATTSNHNHDGSYVNVTGDSMSGTLMCNTTIKDHSSPTEQCLVINANSIPSGTTLSDKNAPGIGFHIGQNSWGSLIFRDGAFKFINNAATGYMPVYASIFYGSLSGNASSATGVQDYNDTSRVIQIGYQGGGATTSNLAYIAGYLTGGTKIKDVSKDVLQSWLGLGSAAYTASSDYATSGHTHNYAGSSSAGGAATSAIKADYLSTYAASHSTNDIIECLKVAFDSVPKSVGTAVRLERGSHNMAFGWFLNGYTKANAYGGWFISEYGTPSWVGVDNGIWTKSNFITSKNIGSQSVNYATSAGSASSASTSTVAAKLGQAGNTSQPMTFHWSGQSGTPTWIFGGSSYSDIYVYSPSNFSVNYANSAGSATSATKATQDGSGNTITSTYATKTELNGKQASISGAASTITSSNLTANKMLYSNSSGKVAASAYTFDGTRLISSNNTGFYSYDSGGTYHPVIGISSNNNLIINAAANKGTSNVVHTYMYIQKTAGSERSFCVIGDNTSGEAHQLFRVGYKNTVTNGSNYYAYAKIEPVYTLTTSSSANVVVGSDGSMKRSTSASKYKLNISQINEEDAYSYNVLKLNPKQWHDKASIETYSNYLTKEANGEKLSSEELFEKNNLDISPHYGLIAEDLEQAGLSKYCQYELNEESENVELEGIQYDKVTTLLIPVVRDLTLFAQKVAPHIDVSGMDDTTREELAVLLNRINSFKESEVIK